MPLACRGGGALDPCSDTSSSRWPRALPPAAAAGLAAAATAEAVSSTMLFQAPQSSQRPAHLAWAAPQFWQTKDRCGLAIDRARLVVLRGTGPPAAVNWGSGRGRTSPRLDR
jgi:hypothetical protein